MSGKRPGSKGYDIQRARLRKELEDSGQANDRGADERANEILQDERGRQGVVRTERGLGPKGAR
ncbi:phosphatidylethanolamine-binding protein [Solwaraspora sp. WMMD791]|uniref:phosphatidylethanolamine-binding protein n=1 Tax=unclassified Solwaraspora TaxID=2627926 RepID=UPI00249AC3BD|nr:MULTISPECIES: phosphatidylethanolamine-binding protein [unclassified Solwaraspora]WFE26018.1 phosphatidylethanolamine-binding protein [Solwaraspora sp. WMMD791]WJK41385.1 phosphatidylethanolamine-binding protein [Solwaraspora sp. WMMA2056]